LLILLSLVFVEFTVVSSTHFTWVTGLQDAYYFGLSQMAKQLKNVAILLINNWATDRDFWSTHFCENL